jgi:lipopolysaccharide export system protein LptC
MPRSLDLRPRLAATQAMIARYSRFVGAMRLLLPLIALGLVAVLVAWPDPYEDDKGFRLTFSNLRTGNGELAMENPRYVGRDSNGMPFEVTALSATQDKEDRKRVSLETIQADMTLSDGTWVSLTANHGIFHQDREVLELGGMVNLYSDRGYEFHALTASADLAAGTVVTADPVRGQGPFGILEANAMRVSDKGKRMIFQDGVKVTIFSGATK